MNSWESISGNADRGGCAGGSCRARRAKADMLQKAVAVHTVCTQLLMVKFKAKIHISFFACTVSNSIVSDSMNTCAATRVGVSWKCCWPESDSADGSARAVFKVVVRFVSELQMAAVERQGLTFGVAGDAVVAMQPHDSFVSYLVGTARSGMLQTAVAVQWGQQVTWHAQVVNRGAMGNGLP